MAFGASSSITYSGNRTPTHPRASKQVFLTATLLVLERVPIRKGELRMTLEELMIDELRDLYSAENQILKALPKIAKAVSSGELKTGLKEHIEQTKVQVERLKQIFANLSKKPTGELCKGMQGLLEEGNEHLEKIDGGSILDAALTGACVRVEHYEIAGYTSVIAIAKSLGHSDIVATLTETLNEEKAAGKRLYEGSKPILKQAKGEGMEEEEEEPEEEEQPAEEPAVMGGRGRKSS